MFTIHPSYCYSNLLCVLLQKHLIHNSSHILICKKVNALFRTRECRPISAEAREANPTS